MINPTRSISTFSTCPISQYEKNHIKHDQYPIGGFLSHGGTGVPQTFSSILDEDFPWSKPSSYGGTSMTMETPNYFILYFFPGRSPPAPVGFPEPRVASEQAVTSVTTVYPRKKGGPWISFNRESKCVCFYGKYHKCMWMHDIWW